MKIETEKRIKSREFCIYKNHLYEIENNAINIAFTPIHSSERIAKMDSLRCQSIPMFKLQTY